MDQEKRALLAEAVHLIGEAQGEVMHALTFLSMDYGEDALPGISEDVARFTEWLKAHHDVIAKADHLIPRTIVVVAPFRIDVM